MSTNCESARTESIRNREASGGEGGECLSHEVVREGLFDVVTFKLELEG